MASPRQSAGRLVRATGGSSIGQKEGRALIQKTNIEPPEPNRVESHLNSGNFPSNPIAPEPLRTVQLPYERAYRLATMPRSKWDDKTWGTFLATLAAFPGAAHSVLEGMKKESIFYWDF